MVSGIMLQNSFIKKKLRHATPSSGLIVESGGGRHETPTWQWRYLSSQATETAFGNAFLPV